MKTLHQYIEEGLLAGMDDTLDRGEDDIKKILVEDFINDLYVCESGKSQIPKIGRASCRERVCLSV